MGNNKKVKFNEKRADKFTWKSGDISITDDKGNELHKK